MSNDIYIIKVNKICTYCGARNEINTLVDYQVDAIACGRCGKYFMLPDNMTECDFENLDKLINNAIEGAI